MQDFKTIFEILGSIAEQRSRLLASEAKLWVDVRHLCLHAATVAIGQPEKVLPAEQRVVDSDTLLSTIQAAGHLNLAPSTLNKWRLSGEGPVFAKLGRRVFYRLSELENFVTTRIRSNTSGYR